MAGTELEPSSFAKLDRWNSDDHAASFAAFRKSCGALLKRRGNIRPFAEDLQVACRAAAAIPLPADEETARKFFEENFLPVRISRLGERDGFLTVTPFRFRIKNVDEHFHLPLKFTRWG